MGRYLFYLAVILSAYRADAQLANGATAPDFTVNDINGVSYSLYNKMNGRGACVAFEATWCGICWQFHEDGILQNIYNNLSADATAVFLEADFSSNTDCLYGLPTCNGITHGDWVTGSPYQICDLSPTNGPNVKSDYAQTYFPTIYVISPDKRAWEVHNFVYSEFVNWLTKSFKLAATGTPVNCTCGDNGKITLNVTGGYGAIAYNWSNGSNSKDLINLPPGTYSVTVTDGNGYFKTFGPWIVGNPPKQVDITNSLLTDVKCYNESTGSIDLTVAYGAPPYTYNWSNGKYTKYIDKLKVGNYTVTVSDNTGCTKTKSYSIIQPTILNLSANVTKDECDEMNGTISAKAIGGVPPYYFDIGLGKQQTLLFSDLKGGKDYKITLTDENACTLTLTVTVDITHKPKANAGPAKAFVDCINQSLDLDGGKSSQGSSFNYLWTTSDGNIIKGAESLYPEINKPGKYDLKVTDVTNKCVDAESVNVTDKRSYPNIKAVGDTTLNCQLTESLLKGSSDSLPVIFYWKKAFDSLFYQDGKNLIASDSGSYILFVKDSLNSCTTIDTVFIQKNQTKPTASASTQKEVSCKIPEITIDGSTSSQGPDIQYQWSTIDGNIVSGANSLLPLVNKGGDYKLQVFNASNYCEQTATVKVIQHTLPIADFFHTANGLSVQFEDQSSGVPTSWKWNFGEPNSTDNTSTEKNPIHNYAAEGQYTVSLIVENDCGAIEKLDDKVFVGMASPLNVNWNITNVKCFGGDDGAIILDVKGGIPPYTYAWSNQQTSKDITNLAAGNYSVIVTDQQGSKISKSFEIIQAEETLVNHADITNTQIGQFTGSIFLSMEGGKTFSFLWSNGQTTNPIQALSAGDYSCTVTDINFCAKEFGPYTVNEITGSVELGGVNGIIQFNVLPNPVNNNGLIDLKFAETQKYRIDLITVFGKRIWSAHYENNGILLPIDVSPFPKGIYFIVLHTEKTEMIIKWLVL